MSSISIGIGLAREGRRVLLVDVDSQGSMTASLGYQQPDQMETTLSTILSGIIMDEPLPPGSGILHHEEGVDLLPANIELAGMEVTLVNTMSRETILRQYLNTVRGEYDAIILDCMPSLGMLTINALAAADSVIVPVQAHYLPLKGMTQLMKTIGKVQRQINPGLKVDGVLLTLADMRTNLARATADNLRQNYGRVINVYQTIIPVAVKAAETSAEGKSIFIHVPKGIVAEGYAALTKEVLSHGES